MNLIIDVGNTNIKLAVFNKVELLEKHVVKHDFLLEAVIKTIKNHHTVNKAIISSVGNLVEQDVLSIKKNIKETIVLNHKTKLPFKNLYKTPKTLGVDRIALVSASVNQFPKNNVLIIDAGTCITYDFVTVENEYMGGAISPGIRTRYQSLNNLTANLPLLGFKLPDNLVGNSTEESIHSGVVNGILFEIDGVIEQYNQNYKDLTVILTGGDANFLSKQLKSSIFANSNFLLEGLNFILEYNSN